MATRSLFFHGRLRGVPPPLSFLLCHSSRPNPILPPPPPPPPTTTPVSHVARLVLSCSVGSRPTGQCKISGILRKCPPMPRLGSNTRSRSNTFDILCKNLGRKPMYQSLSEMGNFRLMGCLWIHIGHHLSNATHEAVEPQQVSDNGSSAGYNSDVKVERKKLKGKRAVVRWLKLFRWKKKKEYERMTAEEKILYKLRKAQKKEGRLAEALKKIEPSDSSETTHDPEILTPEEHFYFLKMGHKCKNYVPIGRRGIFQGVILNMHLHWKKHQILKVVVKTFTPEEVREIAADLARLSGGIVLDIQEENTIIMYRGKNYVQPPTEIMSPKITLSRKKALDKSKYRDGLRAVRRFIPRLKEDLELLQVQVEREREGKGTTMTENITPEPGKKEEISSQQLDYLLKFREKESVSTDLNKDESTTESDIMSESEALSDIFETDSDGEQEEKTEQPLYLDEFERFPSVNNSGEQEDFEERLRQISLASKRGDSSSKLELSELDEIDKLFLRAGSLLKKRR